MARPGATISRSPHSAAQAETRTRELEEALALLGVEEHHWLPYRDGQCDAVDEKEAGSRIAAIIDRVGADTVVTFGPEGVTGHPDHCAVSRWVDVALSLTTRSPTLLHAVTTQAERNIDPALDHDFGVFELGWPRVCEPDEVAVHLPLPEPLLERKVQALLLQRSQTERLVEAVGLDAIPGLGLGRVLRGPGLGC